MNYAFAPDLSALAILIVILSVLRSRHPQKQVDLWLLGLLLTLVEAVAHTFYAPSGMPNRFLHVIVMDCYLLAGLVFTLASGNKELNATIRPRYIVLNGLPLLAINTVYALHYRTPGPYFGFVALGLIVGLASSIYLRRSWLRGGLHLCGWLAIGFLIKAGDYREAVYWSLCCVYAIAALNFHRRLPSRSTGKLAIVTGFSIWALCFLLHPWVVVHYAAFADIASHVWNMQKSLISIGMILVMLEEQVSNNQWLALHDELTGLANRRSFEDQLACALDRSRRRNSSVALLMLDLNGFKRINDTLGHCVGDQVLREVAKNLREHVRSFDTLARLGGDEFTMIASDVSDDRSLEGLLNDVRRAVERPLVIDGQRMVVTASLGAAIYPDDASDEAGLLRVADQRMYLLKRKPALPQRVRPEMSPVSGRLAVDATALIASESSRRRLRAAMADDASS
jgi:diguanylate cyclase (GGDEF)-like protein